MLSAEIIFCYFAVTVVALIGLKRRRIKQQLRPSILLTELSCLLVLHSVTTVSLTLQISYPSALALMEHLKHMGEGNATLSRHYSVGADTFLATAALYQGMKAV